MDRNALATRLDLIKKLVDETSFALSDKGNAEEFLDELANANLALEDALEIVDRDIAYSEYLRQVTSSLKIS